MISSKLRLERCHIHFSTLFHRSNRLEPTGRLLVVKHSRCVNKSSAGIEAEFGVPSSDAVKMRPPSMRSCHGTTFGRPENRADDRDGPEISLKSRVALFIRFVTLSDWIPTI